MSVGLRQSYATLRVLWSEKTTVCRIFSCQRSHLGVSPPDPRSLIRRVPKARLHSLAFTNNVSLAGVFSSQRWPRLESITSALRSVRHRSSAHTIGADVG